MCLREVVGAAETSFWTFVPPPRPRLGGVFSSTVGRRVEVMLELSLLACFGWWMAWPVLGLRSAAGRSGVAPRRRRLGTPDLEVEGELEVHPRPARHSDMWAVLLFLVVHKAFGRWSFLLLGHGGLRLFVLRRFGVACDRRSCSVGAVNPRVCYVILPFFTGVSASCMGLRIQRGCIRMCTYFVLYLSLT